MVASPSADSSVEAKVMTAGKRARQAIVAGNSNGVVKVGGVPPFDGHRVFTPRAVGRDGSAARLPLGVR